MQSEDVAAESPGGGVSVKAAREVLVKNNGHVGVLTESVVSSSDVKSEQSNNDTKDRSDEDSSDQNEKSEMGESDEHERSSTSQNVRTSVFDVAAASSSYMDDSVTKNHEPHSLYGSFTWKVPNFKDVSKRELKSSSFSVGQYKWYILVYPNGCDVSNHLSLFLCVADYDKLLPGWSHFAQFTIAVVNKDPKKSKYSDTLHRFCKKEHDWGWKKFMELGKMQDGFVVSDTLVIKVQVQVIKDRQIAPFRTLDSHYRKELIRVYLSNIEGIVRRSVEKTKDLVAQLLERGVEDFWSELSQKEKEKLSSTPSGPLLKSFTKVFFNEKEVTSTLMMDAAYCAMKVLDLSHKRKFEGFTWSSLEQISPSAHAFRDYVDSLKSNIYLTESKNAFVFKEDALDMLASFVLDPLSVYPFTDTKDGSSTEKDNESLESTDMKASAEMDELKLIDLARLTMEVFAMAQIAEQNIDNAWKEAEIIRRQEELIREEEEAHKDQAVRLAAKAEAERERKARKKERQRAKKEAERIKQEALEAAKAREEELKKLEQERKRQEAEEKKREEEAKKEAERQRQLELKHAALSAKKLAKSRNRSTDDAEKAISSMQDDTDSLEDSSGITSARSDQSSKGASKSSKGGITPQQTTPEAEHSSRSSGSTQDNIVAEMRILLQKRDAEIVFLKEKIKSLEEDLENALSRLNTNSSPSSRSQSSTISGLQPADEASMQNTSNTVMQPAGVTSHAYIMQQMAKAANPPDPVLAGAVSHRVSQPANGMKSSGSHKDIASMTNASRNAGVNFRVGTQGQVGRTQIHLNQVRHQQMGQRGSQYIAGYTNGNTMVNSTKSVGYGQFSQQGTGSGPQVSRPIMNSSQNRLSPKMNNNRGYQVSNEGIQTNMNRQGDPNHQGNPRQIGEGSGLDDFAHLGLITDLLE